MMTILQISTLLADGKPIPGLTDAQNVKALEIWAKSPREAQGYVMDILNPSVKRTLL